MRRMECFYGRNTTASTDRLNITGSNGSKLGTMITGKASLHPAALNDTNNTFKVPNSYNISSSKRRTLKSAISPRRRIQAGRVKNDSKLSQQHKGSFRGSSSFLHVTRKSVHPGCVRSNESKKELIKKMVFLAECASKDRKEVKQSTPVKVVPMFTPKKTPRSRGYLVLPEFSKKAPNLRELRSPLIDLVKKETGKWSNVKGTPCSAFKAINASIKEEQIDVSYEGLKTDTTITHNAQLFVPEIDSKSATKLLQHVQFHNIQVSDIFRKLQIAHDSFEDIVKVQPSYKIYDEFCQYQSKKQELYVTMKNLEDKLGDVLRSENDFGDTLAVYIKDSREVLNKQLQLHKDFQNTVQRALEKCQSEENITQPEQVIIKTTIKDEEKPKLRRSLRLSRLPMKVKLEEETPIKRRLLRLDNKSRGIHRVKY